MAHSDNTLCQVKNLSLAA